MTNPFQKFNDAMACVLRGGKAWRGMSPYNHVSIDPEEGRFMNTGINGEPWPYEITPDDLTATDWVWEEAS